MNRRSLEKYAPQARRDFIQAVTSRALRFGIRKPAGGAITFDPVTVEGDVAIINGEAFPRAVALQRRRLEDRIARHGFAETMEAIAYTWFNRLVAIRFMELHGYLDHGYRALSHPEGKPFPEVLDHASELELPGLNRAAVLEMQLAGGREEELYRMLLVAQCNALHRAIPFLFERIDDETELLLPDNLLHSDSIVRKLVGSIEEENWREVEIIGWLYQFYISERKAEVIGKVVASEDIPAATQLFTPNWIVKYLVQNSLGRQWMATYPDSPLRGRMEYYIEPAEQTPEVLEQLRAITPASLNPEELTLLDPACGSGHILVEAYDLFKMIYQELGYRAKDIPRIILEKNLYGLEIDDRAAQLAGFALLMKARADDRSILREGMQPHVLSMQEPPAIREKDVVEALNRPIAGAAPMLERRSLFQEIDDAEAPLFSSANVAVSEGIGIEIIRALYDQFRDAKTFGSLIRIDDGLKAALPALAARTREVIEHGEMFDRETARGILPLVEQAELLARQYDAVVANPPYMGSNLQNEILKSFAKKMFEHSYHDLYSMFIERAYYFSVVDIGYIAMITMHSWMFLSSYEEFRANLLARRTLLTMSHLGARAFSSISGEVVTVTAFIILSTAASQYRPVFLRAVEGDEDLKQEVIRDNRHRFDQRGQSDFMQIPGHIISYWISERQLYIYKNTKPLLHTAHPKQGLATGDDGRFLRHWSEVSIERINFSARDRDEANRSAKRWFPFNKGGHFRKWYGNIELVVNWENDGYELRNFFDRDGRLRSRPQNIDAYFLPGISWSLISGGSTGFRLFDSGMIIGHKGPGLFSKTDIYQILSFLNSNTAISLLSIISPTLGFEIGQISKLPYIPPPANCGIIARKLTELHRIDWDNHETSWDFTYCILLGANSKQSDTQSSWNHWLSRQTELLQEVRDLETRNNFELIRASGLQDELSPEVPEDQITLYRPNREEDMKRLISYAVGCIMGRYSLDAPGLIYAHAGNKGFDPSKYATFPADADGIIPITEEEWFDDDAANRFTAFIKTAWPAEGLEDNLAFVAESLAPGKASDPRAAIRKYMVAGFFKHHLSLYKRRPIYWLFSSGKLRAFQCLVYLHRYNEGTLSRMRTEYVIPLQGRLDARMETLREDIGKATSTSHRRKLEKERESLLKQSAELRAFDEKLRHYADMRIALDLDDGVKVNYAKFGDLLAEVKAVTGGKEE